ncbi:MaoC family dehydratase [Nocardioides sp. W7]|uniref:MaoC family dehydratase n=1 Tax=Nocardioides sp. W7 TaxID=2931390 RepID=UPI001FD08539|nr:MaoC family dehydratase [Nocardioides sp. W7]
MSLRPTRSATDVQPGEALPPLTVDLTRTLIVSTALATRDYQDVHHDPELAVARGSKDIFMNILTSNGYAERFVAEWAGPAAVVRRLALRLGAPNYPGDTMTLTGEVTAVHECTVEVRVAATNSSGTHLSGTVVVELPASARSGAAS